MFLSSSSHVPAENNDDFDDGEDGDGDAADKELVDEGICTFTLPRGQRDDNKPVNEHGPPSFTLRGIVNEHGPPSNREWTRRDDHTCTA